MSRLKTSLCALTLCSIGIPFPSALFSGNLTELTQYFARCTGQLSAMMEFQWLTSDPASDQTERSRDQMIDLLDAVMPPGSAREVLALRINAEQAFSTLLMRSYFNDDPDDIAWSQDRINREIANCNGLLLN